MRLIKFAAVTALMITSMSAQAASIVVTDSGNIGEFTFTNTGISGSTATIAVSVPSLTSQINTVNGAIVPAELIRVTTPLSFTVTPTGGGQYALDLLGSVTKTVGLTPGQQAVMGIDLTAGDTPLALPNFFNASGPVTSLITNANPNYDFALFALPGGRINLTFTATAFTNTTSFAGLFSTVGATAVGNGSFSQAAVPEPMSIATLSMGLGVVMVSYLRRRLA